MWMVGCSNGSELNMSDSFNGRKLRHLIPRPTSTSPKRTINSAITTHPYISCIHGTHLFALNHRLATATEQSKKDFDQPPLVSSRWNPTPQQLQALEDMYRRGTRTPTAEQIQQIAAQLRQFGKIEGKNVFYWFQNHKARERQKRRRESELPFEEQQGDNERRQDRKDSGLRRTGFEVEETKNWAPPSNRSTLSEESISIHRAAVAAEIRTDGWIQFEGRELQQRRNTVEKHATWQKIELSYSPLPHLINTITTTPEAKALTTIDPKLINIQNRGIGENFIYSEDENRGETQTLQLFPVRSDDCCCISVSEKDRKVPITTIDANTACQFFEFLPLKN